MSLTNTLTSEELEALIRTARLAASRAYCVYSRFAVGAALLTHSGNVISGCNVENASYGLTICAERSAVFQAVAAGQTQFRAIVIYTPTLLPTAPCGACRQVLNEFSPDLQVICVCDSDERRTYQLSELLPAAFGPQNLNVARKVG